MDFDEALAAATETRGPCCTLGRFLDELPDDQRAKVQAALDGGVKQTHIAKALATMTKDPVWNSRGQMVSTHRLQH